MKNDSPQHNPEEDLKGMKLIGPASFIIKVNKEDESQGGIIIPVTEDKSKDYKVKVEKTENCKYATEGKTVLLKDNCPQKATFTVNGNDYAIIEEMNVAAIFDKEDE